MENREYYANVMFDGLNLNTVAERYGITFNRGGFTRCPFHNEKTASFKIEPNGKFGHCFGCGRNATIFSLTMHLFGLDYNGALEKLNNDFAFGFDIGKKPTLKQQRQSQAKRKEAEAKKALQLATLEKYETLNTLWSYYDWCVINLAPKNCEDEIDPRYAEAVKYMEYVKYLLGDFDMREVRSG